MNSFYQLDTRWDISHAFDGVLSRKNSEFWSTKRKVRMPELHVSPNFLASGLIRNIV